jgi:hypothetical protein
MRSEIEKYNDMENRMFGYADGVDGKSVVSEIDNNELFSSSLNDIDFSNISGRNFKEKFSNANRKIKTTTKFKKVIVPDNRSVIVEGVNKRQFSTGKRKQPPLAQKQNNKHLRREKDSRTIERNNIPISEDGFYKVDSEGQKSVSKIVVPENRKVIIESVNKFILDESPKVDAFKKVGYLNGKKLKELILTFNNTSAVDFELEIFNPSMPLDYMYSTSQNLNDKIKVAGGEVSYSDVLYNLLANTAMIPSAKFIFAGGDVSAQKVIPVIVKNKSIEGVEKVYPFNLDLSYDTMQVASDIVTFSFLDTINRPYIPDGMDVIKYKVLAGMSVTMCFFYEQVNLKKIFYKQAKLDKGLL